MSDSCAESDALREMEDTFRHLVMNEFPLESRIAFHLIYLYSFASPRIAGLLAHTKLMEKEPGRRATDTTLLHYSLIHYGFTSPEGQRILRRLNEVHGRWRIRNHDYLGALATFVVVGLDAINRYGPRPLNSQEQQVVCDWYRELGSRLGITEIPNGPEDFRKTYLMFISGSARLNRAGQRLMVAHLDLFTVGLPPVLRPVAKRLAEPLARIALALIADECIRPALGLPHPYAPLQRIADQTVRAWITWTRQSGRGPKPFEPGGRYRGYPVGYTIEDLGPR